MKAAMLTVALLASACASDLSDDSSAVDDGKFDNAATGGNGLGGAYSSDGTSVRFKVYSGTATRIEVDLYDQAFGADEKKTAPLTRGDGGVWSVVIPTAELQAAGLTGQIYYGYRAWGPNWTYDATWTKGSPAGFITDVDSAGNRFNPNKLLLDPYAIEMSHDPINPQHTDGTVFASGPQYRTKDSGRVASKAVLLHSDHEAIGTRPTGALKDDVIYEVHLRGFTKGDSNVSARGTYAGAAQKAGYLKSLGVTAVEFLPVQETQNDQNDLVASTDGDNYWGYMTLAYFAPDRRFAADQSPGGPTREFKQMVRAFHDQGIKVYIDVVYNHTGEGSFWNGDSDVVNIESFRGLDNAAYYELMNDNRWVKDNNGVAGNFNTANDVARDVIIHSLQYWKNQMGVDGFRFDLAAVLGNSCQKNCFEFDKLDPKNALNRAVTELPARSDGGGVGVDLIAEPWALNDGNTYQLGNFPWHWAEWNGQFRDTLRAAQNRMGVGGDVTMGQLATRIAGSSDLFGDDGRKPFHSINFIDIHDGFTLRDLYTYNEKNNLQAWPYGPSDGGESNNTSWDQYGDPTRQRQAARTGFAMLMLSAGVPMFAGGDEMYRTLRGNNNAYNLDTDKNWLDYSNLTTNASFAAFARRMIQFRTAHSMLSRSAFYSGSDHNSNGLKDITWYRDDGGEADGGYMNDLSKHYLAYRIDGTEAGDSATSIFVAYNGWEGTISAHLPAPTPGHTWYRVADTAAWWESAGNSADPGSEAAMTGSTYDVAGRSVLVLIER